MAAKKIRLLLIGIACSVMYSYAQTERSLALLITKSDGTSIGYCLDRFPVLAFEENLFKVSNEGLTESFLWEDVVSLSYIKESTQILSRENRNSSVFFYENGVSVYSSGNYPITVYDVNGKIVYSKLSEQNTSTFIEYSQFSHGFYILKSGNNIFKFYAK